MNYLKLIRFQNLLLIAIMLTVFRYLFLKKVVVLSNETVFALSNTNFILLVFAVVLIAAGGYIINNINDQEADEISNKRIVGTLISEETAYNSYMFFTITGVSLGFFISNSINKPSYLSVFIIVAALLYSYATTLKKIPFVKNIVVSILVVISLIILPIFDLIPMINSNTITLINELFDVFLQYSIFLFIVTLMREIVKDIEDEQADYSVGIATLPIIFGRKKTAYFLLGLTVLLAVLLVIFLKNNLFQHHYVLLYFLFGILAPLVFFGIKIVAATTTKEFKQLSLLLKIVMLLGIFSIAIITHSITNA